MPVSSHTHTPSRPRTHTRPAVHARTSRAHTPRAAHDFEAVDVLTALSHNPQTGLSVEHDGPGWVSAAALVAPERWRVIAHRTAEAQTTSLATASHLALRSYARLMVRGPLQAWLATGRMPDLNRRAWWARIATDGTTRRTSWSTARWLPGSASARVTADVISRHMDPIVAAAAAVAQSDTTPLWGEVAESVAETMCLAWRAADPRTQPAVRELAQRLNQSRAWGPQLHVHLALERVEGMPRLCYHRDVAAVA